MNLKLRIAEIHLPGRIRKGKISELAALTARGFGLPAPPLEGLSTRGRLEAYARFTRGSVDAAVAAGADLAAIRERLRGEALAFGRDLALVFGIRGRDEAARLLRLAYRAIGIDLEAGTDGRVRVLRCAFREYYGPETCRTIAALDEGIMAGILGEGRLVFSARMTEGHPDCRAVFHVREARP
jgi:hypothetical protein